MISNYSLWPVGRFREFDSVGSGDDDDDDDDGSG